MKDTGEIVAIKIIPLGSDDDIAEIQKEIEMLQECNHPNIVRYLVRSSLPLPNLPFPCLSSAYSS